MIDGLEIPPQLGYPILIGAILALLGYALNRALKNRPSPPTTAEAWDEAREVRGEIKDMRAAFDVVFRVIEQTARDWNKGKPYPKLSVADRAIVAKVRAIPEPLNGDTGETSVRPKDTP